MEERTRVKNGMIKDIVGVDCNECQHKNVCRFCESAETFIRDMKGEYPTGGAAPFVLNVTCTHKTSVATLTSAVDVDVLGGYPKAIPTLPKQITDTVKNVSELVQVAEHGGRTTREFHDTQTGAINDDMVYRSTVPAIEDNGSDKTDPSNIVTRELK